LVAKISVNVSHTAASSPVKLASQSIVLLKLGVAILEVGTPVPNWFAGGLVIVDGPLVVAAAAGADAFPKAEKAFLPWTTGIPSTFLMSNAFN
jgi:hypothetical protein